MMPKKGKGRGRVEIETLKRSHLKRNIIIGVSAVLIISAIILNFTRAKYRVTQSIPLVNGTINYSLADLNIVALYIDGVAAEELDSSKNYTLDTTQSTCTYKDGSTIQNLTLNYDSNTKTFTIAPYTTKGTKCTLYFEESKGTPAVDVIEEVYNTNPNILAYDEANNLRYIGANPNNYVSFNNELWRIIGVFSEDTHGVSGQKLIKIIRNESIGNYSWDNKPRGTGSSTSGYGSNDWSDSTLQAVLNSGAYWNRASGTCPSGQNGATTNCDFSSTGLTEEAKSMIATVTWKLGGTASHTSASNGLASHFYGYERGTTVYSGRPTTWSGKVALMYPSDYGYATSGGSTTNREACLAKELYNWGSSSDCYTNDWLYDSSTTQWTLTPRTSISNNVFNVWSTGSVTFSSAGFSYVVRPSVYLTSNVKILGGDGTSNSPYTLEV